MATAQQRSCVFFPLGTIEYPRALALQQGVLAAKLENRQTPDRLVFIEHYPVYTLGRRGGRENLVVSPSFLADKGIDIVQTDRGGNITYHGPGQAVLYPVIDLENNRLSVPDFVSGMEEIMKQVCLEFDVPADRDGRNHGIWVGDKKIGSVGISIKKGVSIHGLALNVNPDLAPFSWINPCGLANQAMTSIAAEKGWESRNLDDAATQTDRSLMDRIGRRFVHYFSHVFNFEIKKEKHP